MRDTKDMISVVIPAYNEEKYVAKCIQSIKRQKDRNIEIIVVCNRCKDNTAKIARKLGAKTIIMSVANVSEARNRGARASKGSILIFIDADSVMGKGLLRKVRLNIKEGYVGGTCAPKPIEDIMFAKVWWFMGRIINYVYLTPSGFLFARKDAFPGYNKKVSLGEDTILLKKLNDTGKIKYISDSYIYTSSRRFEKEGYIWTLVKQMSGLILKKNFRYAPVR